MIDLDTGFFFIPLLDTPLRPNLCLDEFMASRAFGQCRRQSWPRWEVISIIPPQTIGKMNFRVTLHFEYEMLRIVELVDTLYPSQLSWLDRLSLFFSPRFRSNDESRVVLSKWLPETLGQELDSQVYPWGTITLVDDLSRGPADRFVYIEIKYFEYRSR